MLYLDDTTAVNDLLKRQNFIFLPFFAVNVVSVKNVVGVIYI